MNKLFKYSLLLMTVGLLFTACKDTDDISQQTPITLYGPQAYFSNEMPEVYELSKDASSFVVTLCRQSTQGTVTVPITVTMPEGSIYNVPSSVTFLDGQSTADVVITYDPDLLNYGDYTDITLSVDDPTISTPFGLNTYTFSAGATEWEDMGMALYREDLVTCIFNGVENLVYEVPIQKSVVTEGMYRLVNPYGEYYPYNDPGDYDATTDSYIVINASDPDYVWVETIQTTMDWGYGTFWFPSEVSYDLEQGSTLEALKSQIPEYFGTLKDGVITMPVNSIYGAMTGYNDNKITFQCCRNGLFGVALPGARFADYNISYEFEGRFIDTAGNIYAQGYAELGEDIASAKAALVTEATYQDELAKILEGSGGVDVVSGESFFLPFTESGTYYVLIVGFDAAGEAVQAITSRVMLENPAEAQDVTWVAKYVGDYTYALFSDPDNDDWTIDEGITLYYDQDDESHMKIAPWMDDSHQLEFTMNADGTLVVPEQGTGFNYDGELFVQDVTSFTQGDEEYAQYVSKFENNTFTFYLVYFNEKYAFIRQDTYVLTGYAEVKQMVKVSSKKTVMRSFNKKDAALGLYKNRMSSFINR